MTDDFDSQKDAANRAKHGLGFEEIEELDWGKAVTRIDGRHHYGETRFVTYAMRGGRLHCLVWTPRDGGLRPISFRKANEKEKRRYEKEIHKTH